jgi:hypothetical protein
VNGISSEQQQQQQQQQQRPTPATADTSADALKWPFSGPQYKLKSERVYIFCDIYTLQKTTHETNYLLRFFFLILARFFSVFYSICLFYCHYAIRLSSICHYAISHSGSKQTRGFFS